MKTKHKNRTKLRIVGRKERLKALEGRFDELEKRFENTDRNLNQNFSLLFRNERHIADLLYTVSTRQAVIKRLLIQHKLTDDLAFEALVDQEVAKRKEEEERARAEAIEKAKTQTATERAKELGKELDKNIPPEEKTLEFGGDFEEVENGSRVEAEEGDQDSGGEVGGSGSDVDGGPVDETGPAPDDVRQVGD